MPLPGQPAAPVAQLQEQVRQLQEQVRQLQEQVRQLIANTEQGGVLHTNVANCLRRTHELRDGLTNLEEWRGQWQ